MRAIVGRGGPLDVGLFHSEAERSKFTFEIWLLREDLSVEMDNPVVIARRQVLLKPNELRPSIWTLYISKDGKLCFQFDKIPNFEVSSDAGSINLGPTSDVDFALWNHVALVLDSDCGDSTAEVETEIRLFINGSMKGRGRTTPPLYSEPEIISTMLLFCPDLWGWRFTELRLWACARSADEIDNFRENYLSLASKRKRLQYRVKGGKKLFGPLVLPQIGEPGGLVEKNTTIDAAENCMPSNQSTLKESSGISSQQKIVFQSSPFKINSSSRSATTARSKPSDFGNSASIDIDIIVKPVGSLAGLDISLDDLTGRQNITHPHDFADSIVICKNGEIIVVTVTAELSLNTVRYKLVAESAILCPRIDVKIIALYSQKKLCVYNVDTRKKIVEQPISANLLFWKYISLNTVILVTPKVIYTWEVDPDSITNSSRKPLRVCSLNISEG